MILVSIFGTAPLPMLGRSLAASGSAAPARLIVDPDAVFVGSIASEGVATLELESAAGAGAITGIGSSFSGFGAFTVDAGATWVAFGSVTVAGTVGIGAGADMVFEDAVAATTLVDFVTNTGLLGIGDPAGFAATVFGFQVGDAFVGVGLPTRRQVRGGALTRSSKAEVAATDTRRKGQ
jgi:hypothetical protein